MTMTTTATTTATVAATAVATTMTATLPPPFSGPVTKRRLLLQDLLLFLRLVEENFSDVEIHVRGNEITAEGSQAPVVGQVFEELVQVLEGGQRLLQVCSGIVDGVGAEGRRPGQRQRAGQPQQQARGLAQINGTSRS